MLTRELARQIEAYWEQSQNPTMSGVQRFESMMKAGLLLAATDGEAADDGQYDVEYIKEIQMMYLSYKAWLIADVEATFMGNPVTVDKTPRELIMQAPVTPPTS